MGTMTDLDMIREGLGICSKGVCSKYCPYIFLKDLNRAPGTRCADLLMADALRMLEPRVYSLKEAKQAEFGWLEVDSGNGKPAGGPALVYEQFQLETVFILRHGHIVTAKHCQYAGKDKTSSKRWRLWTAKPTDIQRAREPWI